MQPKTETSESCSMEGSWKYEASQKLHCLNSLPGVKSLPVQMPITLHAKFTPSVTSHVQHALNSAHAQAGMAWG